MTKRIFRKIGSSGKSLLLALCILFFSFPVLAASGDEIKEAGEWNHQGQQLILRAMNAETEDQQRLWREAGEKLRKATEINPDMYEAWLMWGNTLFQCALVAQGEEQQRLWKESEGKFQKVTEIRPKMYEAWLAWETILLYHANSVQGEEREQLLIQAREKLETADAIKAGR